MNRTDGFEPSGSRPTAPRNLPAAKILYAEDDDDLRRLVASGLRSAGYEIAVAADGRQAWEALQAERFDVLITDHAMPGLTGLELIERLRRAGMTLPIILASASPETWEDPSPGELDFVRLPKPFRREDLLHQIRCLTAPDGERTRMVTPHHRQGTHG